MDQAAAAGCGVHPYVLGKCPDQEKPTAALGRRLRWIDRGGVETDPVVTNVDRAAILTDLEKDLEALRAGRVADHVGARLGDRELQIGAGLPVHVQDVEGAAQQSTHGGDAAHLTRQIEPDCHTHASHVPARRPA
jgi:hypothetical protein